MIAHAGKIPEDLEGTLLRNGPGLFEIGGIPVSQPFDGDGMVSCTHPVASRHLHQSLEGA